MPLWTRYIVEGRLTRRYGGLALAVDDGGIWRLEYLRRYDHLLGKRVRVDGTRDGFDLLAVNRLSLLGPDSKPLVIHEDRLRRAGRVLRYVSVQVARRIRRQTRRRKDRALVAFENSEPMRDIGGMVGTRLVGETEIGAEKR